MGTAAKVRVLDRLDNNNNNNNHNDNNNNTNYNNNISVAYLRVHLRGEAFLLSCLERTNRNLYLYR